MELTSYYQKIWLRLTLTLCLLIIIPMTVLAISTINNFKDTVIDKTELSIGRLIDHKRDVITLFLKEKEDLLKMLVGMYSMDYLGKQDNLDSLYKAVNQAGSIVDLHVLDSSGNQLSYVGPYRNSLVGKNYYEAQWFKEVMIKGSNISDVFLGFRSMPHFVVAVTDPLKTYILRATINSEHFNQLIISSQIGPNGDSFIVNSEGVLQTPSRQGQKELSAEDKTHFEIHEGTKFFRNDKVIIATKWILNGQWCIFVKSIIEDSLGPFYKDRLSFIGLIIGTSFAFIILAIFLSNYFLSRIELYDEKKTELGHQMVQMEKMATVGRLAAGIAHEINNPLQMITSQAGWITDLLKEEDPSLIPNIEEYSKAAEHIKHHVRRAGTITHRLLTFSRKISPEKQWVQLNSLIEETISFIETESSYNNIAIIRRYSQNLPATMTDGAQLQQVFLNLINNSIDAIEHDGVIEISTKTGVLNDIILEFADTGQGIKSEALKHLFDPFYTTKDPGKGTGLGLYISYDIITKLGGSMKAENRKNNVGAVFTITLPIIKQDLLQR